MKTTKRILACLMILAMLAAMLCVGASADYQKTNGTITITNATSGVTYKAYKVLDMEVNTTTCAYRYKLTPDTVGDDWYDFVVAQTSYFTVSGNYVTANYTNAAALAQIAKKYATDKGLTETQSATASGTSVQITGLECGYYLLLDGGNKVVALVQLLPGNNTAPTTPDVKIKAGLPNITKAVDEPVAYIGQELNYTITVEADVNATNYVITDTAESAITIKTDSVKVSFKGTDITSDPGTNITATTSGITVDLTTYLTSYYAGGNEIKAGDKFVVTYKAALNSTAEMETPYANDAKLTYPGGTIEASVNVITYQLTVIKKDTSDNLLAGAGFKLKNSAGKWAQLDVNNKLTAWVDNEADGTELITTAPDGTIVFKGLGDDIYTIHETTVPTGYVAAADKNVTISNANVTADVVNTPGSTLPETGGIGTTVFYAVGGLLVLGAVVVLLMKKRRVTE